MYINYDIPKLNKVLQDFYNATGINMELAWGDSSPVELHDFEKRIHYCEAIQRSENGHSACRCSDAVLFWESRESKKTAKRICHAGLVNISVPILYDDAILGYIILGQMKTDNDFSEISEYLNDLGLDEAEMRQYYSEIPLFDADKIQSISNLAEIVVKYILLENIFTLNLDENIQRALNYINENLKKDLSIQSISKATNISKSVLYRQFHRYFNCTVNQYISNKRIEKSIDLLSNTALSIEEIAQNVGFASGSYFSKIFKKEKGISPLKYKFKAKI